MPVILKDRKKPQKQPNICCSKCGGKRIIQGEEVKEYSDGTPSSLAMEITTGEKRLFGLADKVEYAWVYANLCVDCGFIDWFMKKQDAEELWKIYSNNNNKV